MDVIFIFTTCIMRCTFIPAVLHLTTANIYQAYIRSRCPFKRGAGSKTSGAMLPLRCCLYGLAARRSIGKVTPHRHENLSRPPRSRTATIAPSPQSCATSFHHQSLSTRPSYIVSNRHMYLTSVVRGHVGSSLKVLRSVLSLDPSLATCIEELHVRRPGYSLAGVSPSLNEDPTFQPTTRDYAPLFESEETSSLSQRM